MPGPWDNDPAVAVADPVVDSSSGNAPASSAPWQNDPIASQSVIGTEFGYNDNPAFGGYTEPNWDVGKWGENLNTKDTVGVALPAKVLNQYGDWRNDPNFADDFNSAHQVLVTSPKTGRSTIAKLADAGPADRLNAGIDMMYGTIDALGLPHGSSHNVNYAIVPKTASSNQRGTEPAAPVQQGPWVNDPPVQSAPGPWANDPPVTPSATPAAPRALPATGVPRAQLIATGGGAGYDQSAAAVGSSPQPAPSAVASPLPEPTPQEASPAPRAQPAFEGPWSADPPVITTARAVSPLWPTRAIPSQEMPTDVTLGEPGSPPYVAGEPLDVRTMQPKQPPEQNDLAKFVQEHLAERVRVGSAVEQRRVSS